MALSEHSLRHLDDVLNNCIHCGMCLPVCPTYALTLQEQSSPRGRIRLIRSVNDGSIPLSEAFADEMNFCLDCQACQTACPAGVQYGELVEDARRLISEKRMEPWRVRVLKKFILDGILASPFRTKLFGRMLLAYERSGTRGALERSGLLGLLSSRLQMKHAMLPHGSPQFFDESVAERVPASGERRGVVALLSGCIMNISFAEIHRDTVELLTMNGFDVVIPKTQVCCGSLHGHNGEIEGAKMLARTNLDVFSGLSFDSLIVNSAGCGAFLKEYGRLLADDASYSPIAAELSSKTMDLTEFLWNRGLRTPLQTLKQRVTYHEACHLVHTQKISKEPRELIASIPGLDFVELPEATWCCGSAGIYNVLRPDDSVALLDRKMKHLASTGAEVVVTGNPGCHLQLQCGIRKLGLRMEVVHPATLLLRASCGERGS